MPRVALFLFIFIFDVASAKTITTRELGWQAGQDVTQRLIALFEQNEVVSGDTLVFSDMYDVQSTTNIELADSITLAGAYFGAGLRVRNTEPEMRNGIFELGNNNTLFNLTFEYKETLAVPPLSEGITSSGRSNTRGILAFADNVKIINSAFKGNVGIHVDASGNNLEVVRSHFDAGTFHLRLLANNQNPSIRATLFENALADGIKTVRGVGTKVDNVLVEGSVFLNNRRDGIDTTGGLSNSVVRNSYFVNLFKRLDLKNIFDENTVSLSLAPLNENILIEDSTFVDNNNALAPITLDRGNSSGVKWITSSNADQYLTRDITVRNSTIQNRESAGIRFLLAVDVHSIEWENLLLIGNVSEFRATRNTDSNSAVNNAIETNYNLAGTGTQFESTEIIRPDSYYRALAGPDTTLKLGSTFPISILQLLLLD